MGRKDEDSEGGGRGGGREEGGRKERRARGREEGKMEGRKGRIFPESLLCVRPWPGRDVQVGKAERPESRAEQVRGRERQAARGGAEPLESCYCLRSLLREAPSKKSLLERARLETSGSQRASEPCEMT